MMHKPQASEKERSCINAEIRKLRMSGRFDEANTQMNRVIAAASGADWHSLRDLENLLAQMFPDEGDTQTAISARLREISPILHGLVKQVHTVRNDESGKTTWFYRLVPSHSEVRL